MIGADEVELDSATLRRAFSCFPSGVTAVCGLVDDEPVGMAASSFTSVSLDPPLVLVCVANDSSTWARLRTAGRLGVSVLSVEQGAGCLQLAARAGDRFAGLSWTSTARGAVAIADAAAWLECDLESELDAGDHTVVLLRIRHLEADPDIDPLVFHRSGFRRLEPAAP